MNCIDRRSFVLSTIGFGLTSLYGVGGAMNAFAQSGNITSSGKIKNIGVQLYTVRDLMEKNVEETISQVAELGYKEVEFAGYFGRTAIQTRQIIDQNGLRAPSTHVGLEEIKGDALKALIEYSIIVGHKYIILPYLDEEDRKTLDQFKGYVELFNKVGEECKSAGIQFCYHNHEFEFDAIDGVEPYDLFLNECDEDLLKMQMDLFWAIKAGRNPVDYFKRYPGRFPLCHVKDMGKDGAMVDVGHGQINFAQLFSYSELAGLKHFIVEHDEPVNSLSSISNSFKTLNAMVIK